MKSEMWHNLPWQKAVKKLKSDFEKGLSEEEIKIRQKKFGKNSLPEEKSLSGMKIFFSQFKSPLIYILVIAGFVTLIFREYADSIVIFGAVFLNTIIGFLQENKSSKALSFLKKAVKYQIRTIRGGNIKIVDSQELAVGDIFLLGPGDKISADGRIIESDNLKINEMALTGEWLAAQKHSDVLDKGVPLADRDNMVYMGTTIEEGAGKAIVTEIGIKTEIGKITKLLKETKEPQTPLQKKISRLGRIIGISVAGISIFIFIGGIIKGEEFIEMFAMAVAIAVAAIPEGLPVATTVILALGMERILKKRGLIRKLLVAETLGSTSIICTDKTGTLTEGKMMVSRILTPTQIFKARLDKVKDGSRFAVLKTIVLCSEAFIENPEEIMKKWVVRGKPTDRAMLLAGTEAGITKKELEKSMVKTGELFFNPIRKYKAVLYSQKKEETLFSCGAPEKILEASKFMEVDGKRKKINSQELSVLNSELESLAQKGLRVLAAGYKKIKVKDKKLKIEEQVNDLVLAGFVAFKDPLRKEVKPAIKKVFQAGMRPILVTGDHKLTAAAIAQEIGILTGEKNVIEGKELDEISDSDFLKRVEDISVYARVEPKHKIRIVRAWQERGETVAMTGDGINDALALKRADIGVALGSGTNVAKEVSDLVLLSDSFNVIVAAIEEGRAIIDNIRKVITYLLANSFAEVFLISSSLFFGWPLPVLAVQILWINLVQDGPLGLSLAFEPKEKNLIKRKPEKKNIPLLNKEMRVIIFITGVILNFLLVGLYWALQNFTNYSIEHMRTVIFVGLIIGSIFFIFACKSLRRNIWDINIFSNKFLIISWLFSAAMILAAVYLPILQVLLKTTPLNLFDWLLLLGLGIVSILFIEITKWHFIAKKIIKIFKK